jgi:4-amino-4-deoxychorismate lyase
MNRVRIYRGEQAMPALATDERGLAYGDGLFETMRIDRGRVPWWSRHCARLADDACRLGIVPPRMSWLDARIAEVVAGVDMGVVKLLLTRGAGGRGYLPPEGLEHTVVFSVHDLPVCSAGGLDVVWSRIRLAAQPALAGIKHLNRLEQVLARREAAAAGADEALMLDADGQVVCATSGNVVVLHDGCWLTPPVTASGVAGVCRGWLIEQGLVRESALLPAQVVAAKAVFLCNAVRGILPVARLDGRGLPPDPAIDSIIGALHEAMPAFAR